MARDIDRKLRATAAALGLITRKDLAAAFRRVNAATPFDIERAHKWLQGRSSPRDARLYQDWVLVLDVDQSAEWIANCEFDAFLEVVARRYDVDREALSRQEMHRILRVPALRMSPALAWQEPMSATQIPGRHTFAVT